MFPNQIMGENDAASGSKFTVVKFNMIGLFSGKKYLYPIIKCVVSCDELIVD